MIIKKLSDILYNLQSQLCYQCCYYSKAAVIVISDSPIQLIIYTANQLITHIQRNTQRHQSNGHRFQCVPISEYL